MPAFTPLRQEQILQQMINTVVARSSLSDLNDASIFKHLLRATSRGVDEAYFQMANLQDVFNLDTARGEDLDERAAEIQPATLSRNLATTATGTVIFTASAGPVVVPSGTVVKTADGISFVTTAAGNTGTQIAAVAQTAGASGNVTAGSIVKFDQKPAGVQSITNTVNFTNGSDRETDSQFRDRIFRFIDTLAQNTIRALEFAAEETEISTGQRVVFSKAVEDDILRGEITLYVDDGAGTAETFDTETDELITEGLGGAADLGDGFPAGDTAVGGEERLYFNNVPLKYLPTAPVLFSGQRGALTEGVDYTYNPADGLIVFSPPLSVDEGIKATYDYYTGLIAEVQKVIDGDINDRVNYPGVRAGGVRVIVTVPTILIQTIEASLTVSEGFTESEVFQNVTNAILDYVNNLGISGDVLRARLTEVIMGVPGVFNMDLVAPASDVIMLDDELPRTSTGNVTLT